MYSIGLISLDSLLVLLLYIDYLSDRLANASHLFTCWDLLLHVSILLMFSLLGSSLEELSK